LRGSERPGCGRSTKSTQGERADSWAHDRNQPTRHPDPPLLVSRERARYRHRRLETGLGIPEAWAWLPLDRTARLDFPGRNVSADQRRQMGELGGPNRGDDTHARSRCLFQDRGPGNVAGVLRGHLPRANRPCL